MGKRWNSWKHKWKSKKTS